MKSSTITEIQRALSQTPKKSLDDPSLAPAGVLLLVYPKNGEYCVLLNKRSDAVEDHKGEIAFPGGRMDEADGTVLETALREAHEEMGIAPQDVGVLGELDDVPTISNYLISPFVGTIPQSYDFKPDSDEVAEVLEAPISALRDERNHRDVVRLVDGRPINTPAYAYEGHLVFGATASVLTRFLDLTNGASDKEIL